MKPYKSLAFMLCLAFVLSACVPIPAPPTGEALQPAAEVQTTEQAVTEEPPRPIRALARVNDITMYYEVHGEGEPLLLLHGGTASGAETWAYQIPRLAESYKVIVPDARAHGRTTDSEQPLSYALMADDYLKLLDKLGIAQADVVGWSDGAIVGLYLVQEHPERVRAYVGMEPNFTVAGLNPQFAEWAAALSSETYPEEWAHQFYLDIAPDPDHFPVFLSKIGKMWSTQPTFTEEDFAANEVPMLLISGEASDVVQPAHLAEWAAALPNATLLSVAGYGHDYPMASPDDFLATVVEFLRQQVSRPAPKLEPKAETPAKEAATAEPTLPPEPHGLRPDAPSYGVRGPYAVGVRNYEIDATEEDERPLNVTVWYPALNSEAAEEAATYTMDFLADPAAGFPTAGHALRDAAPDPSDDAYPLVLYSHGAWCFPAMASFFTEHLASHGFVVMAALHEDNWGTLFESTYKSEISRPRDMVRQLDFAEELTAPGGEMAGLIDTEHVAVSGQSFGGQTALELAGARLNTADWQQTYCADFPENEDCKAYPAHLEEMASLAGLDAVPEGLWPDWSDPRVDVVVATAPAVSMLGGGGLQDVRRPIMLLIGTNDNWVGPAHEYRKFYETLPSPDKARVLFEGADHMIFGNACPAYPGMVDAGFYFVCADSVWDMDRAHDLTNHFTTAFLRAELKGDAEAAAALAPENVAFPGIRYETTAYGAAAPEAATSPKPHGLRFDAPPYAVDGPHKVGVRYFTIPAQSETDRELTASVWYPAIVPGDTPATITYEQKFKPGKIPPFSVLGHALLDAKPDASGAPYPLVVYTHAHWSYGQELAYLTEHLASQGFVVISVDHEDNWSTDFGPMAYQALVHRMQEVTREIDYAEGLSASDGGLPGMIATQKVGIAGWSMGGVTSLAAAGARIDLANLRAWCKEDPSHEAAAGWACVDVLNHEKEMADFAGLSEVPAGLWPDWSDARIAAAVRLSGSPAIFGSKGLESVNMPVLLMHGGGEAATDPAVEMGNPYESVSSDHKAQVVFDDAEHALFFSSCAESPSVLELSQAIGFPTFCADSVWDKDRAHDLINHFTTAFLLAELKGEAEAAAALAPENVSFPGIEYREEGYSAAQAALDPELIAKIEALVEQEMADKDIPGVSLGIVKDGQVAYAKGFGVAERGTDRAMTPQTQFPVACITKGFTTAAIMQLVEQGLVDLDAPVTDYLPYFKLADERYKEITIRHLLANTAGLPMPDYVTLYGGFSHNPSWSPDLLEKYVRSLADKPMATDPADNTFIYGGDYFDILGDVIAKASGQSFEEYMEEHILQPLGLEHTTFIVDELDPELAAAAHWQDANGEMQVSVPSPTYYPAHTPSNGMFSTTEDLLKWAIFNLNRGELDGRQIVPASAYEEMWKPQVEIPWGGIYQHWGYGWGISDVEDHHLVFWGGGHIGSPNAYYLAPEENLGVHVAVNRSLEAAKGTEYADEIAFPIIEMLLAD